MNIPNNNSVLLLYPGPMRGQFCKLSLVTESEEIRKFLISHAILRFVEDAEDMRSFALKGDALRRALQNQNEQDAYKRAIMRMVGNRNVLMPWKID